MPRQGSPENVRPVRAVLARAVLFFALWLAFLPSAKTGDLVIGAFAAAAATSVSVRLLPPTAGGLRLGILVALLPHFLWEGIRAGIDVARRAFAPSLPLRPGFVSYQVGFPAGLARNWFATITSLLPGTVPSGDHDGMLVYHCLDTAQPVAEQLAKEERFFASAFVVGEPHA